MPKLLMTALIALCLSAGAQAAECLPEGEHRTGPLVGKIMTGMTAPIPPQPKSYPFYFVRLDQSTCLDVPAEYDYDDLHDVREIELVGRKALLKRYLNQRVSVRFKRLIMTETHWWQRPVAGEVETIRKVK
jgi:hypothetical protein